MDSLLNYFPKINYSVKVKVYFYFKFFNLVQQINYIS